MNYLLILVGIILSFIGYRWAINARLSPDYYWKEYGRSKLAQDVVQTLTGFLYPGAYLLIVFANGLNKDGLIAGLAIVIILNSVIFPFMAGLLLGKR